MRQIPFYRRIVFKALLLFMTVLFLAFSMSFVITTKKLDKRIEQNLVGKFKTAQHTTENFVELIAQSSQMWAQEIIYDHALNQKIEKNDVEGLSDILKTYKAKISADSIILLDKNGVVLSQEGSAHKRGDSLKYYDVVEETFRQKCSATKIARVNESFIIYSSAVIEEHLDITGVILVGYFVNDIFLENIKKNTNLEIALIGNSAVMSSTKWGGEENLETLPLQYLHYQNLLKNEERVKKITYGGKSFVVSAKKLKEIESLETGSILFGYPYDWFEKQKSAILKEQLLLFGTIFLLASLVISLVVIRYSRYLTVLRDTAVKLSNREPHENIKIETRDELELLAESFNLMADELAILHAGMEEEIALKTKELKALNDNLTETVKEEVEKNRLKEQQLLHQSRLAQMGEMISMIAHQWRQPLAAISATSATIELKASVNRLSDDVALEKAQNISRYSQHLSETIDEFRSFFKPNKEKAETSYDEVVSSVLGIIEVSITTKNIQLFQELNCHETFTTYPNELRQVVLNLVKNAEDALLEKGIKRPFIKIATYTEANRYILEVSDNAGGVPEEIKDRIFDPYFSTKKAKEGTGLGLYMSKTIIEEHCGGELSVSNNSEGAVFKIVLHAVSRRSKMGEDK